jgi:small GTP-binding protein
MSKLYKLVVTGVFNAGKTTFVNMLSDIETVNTDKATSLEAEIKIKPTTTVAMDYGRVQLNENVSIHLFGTPGQERFDFMRDHLSEGMDGFIFLIDSTDQGTLAQARALLTVFEKQSKVPYLVVANKADKKGLSMEELRQALKLPKKQMIVACNSTDHSSVRTVAEHFVSFLENRDGLNN